MRARLAARTWLAGTWARAELAVAASRSPAVSRGLSMANAVLHAFGSHRIGSGLRLTSSLLEFGAQKQAPPWRGWTPSEPGLLGPEA